MPKRLSFGSPIKNDFPSVNGSVNILNNILTLPIAAGEPVLTVCLKQRIMKLNTDMPSPLKPFFRTELQNAGTAFAQNNLPQSWRHLERAHIIGQPYPYHHSLVHWNMLRFGIKTKNPHEITGQIARLLMGGVMSFVGKIPVGNTGGANVPGFQRMEIPEELLQIINQANPGN